MLKLNKLLFHTTDRAAFLHCVVPAAPQRQQLQDAKLVIRKFLQPRIEAATVTVLGMEKPVRPRFRTQGSWSYDTCVQPAETPPQEMDWDYGMYLPVSVWEGNGPPHVMAKKYFDLVEGLLEELCQERGWVLNKKKKKKTCIRIHINDAMHIDLPLYAAPETEFMKIVDRGAIVAKNDSVGTAVYAEDQAQTWGDLAHVSLATRDGEWKKSDPQAVANWFRDCVREHGEQLRRVCRYLKAWRDLHWTAGGPTSVAIMIVVSRAFKACAGRDDLALEHAAELLAAGILSDVFERAIDGGEENFNRLEHADRLHASASATNLYQELRKARLLNSNQAQTAIHIVMGVLGNRIPDRVDLVEADSGELAVRDTPARRQPIPVVGASSAG